MLKHPLTQLDKDQVVTYTYDEEYQAQRVRIVGDNPFNGYPAQSIELGKSELLSTPTPLVVKEIEFKTIEIEKLIVVPEIKVIEVEKIIVQEKLVEVQVPVIVEKLVLKEIEKTVFINSVQPEKDLKFPMWLKICLLSQAMASIGILIVHLIK